MEEKRDTKEIIAQTALTMFSKRGYHAVSIRDICKEVGIKESTVYYYYKNKKDIMDSLIARIDQLMEAMRERFDATFESVPEVTEEAMCEVAVAYFHNFFLNPYVYQMISFLTMERMADPTASEVYQRIVFELPLQQQEKVFQKMIERGFIEDNSVTVLAQEYYAIIYFAFQKNCMREPVTEEQKLLSYEEIRKNIKDLYHKMRGISYE